MAEPGQDWQIEELSADHDRSAFSCGHESLDEFLKKFAGQNQKSGISKTYVATRPDDPTVCGYYSASSGAVQFNDIPETLRKRLPKYPIPIAHLGRLAVDAAAQGHGLGELLLMDALARIMSAADAIGIHALEVVAIDENAKRFYLKYGFTELLDDPHHLYVSIKMLRKAGLA
ncbi:MAG: GNAT family N-acetyltransferase [Phycisphaerales bacterium]|nr:GNAT family N-acetyltransferase [Phycisphaerales bacterium]MDP6890438.1 GNAT family N-acetyltransferase [Phycisphaerales bacterium]